MEFPRKIFIEKLCQRSDGEMWKLSKCNFPLNWKTQLKLCVEKRCGYILVAILQVPAGFKNDSPLSKKLIIKFDVKARDKASGCKLCDKELFAK